MDIGATGGMRREDQHSVGLQRISRRYSHRGTIVVLAVLIGGSASGSTKECESPETPARVSRAVAEIERAVDPCGESDEILRLLADFRRCDPSSYRICIDPRSVRNFVDPGIRDEPGHPTSLTWNPELRTELESSCEGDPARPLLRDPAASLLHEIVHVVQACNGLDPGALEIEAVRIENIYRRARGLCQRTRYGKIALPSRAFVACDRDSCACPLEVVFNVKRASLPAAAGIEIDARH